MAKSMPVGTRIRSVPLPGTTHDLATTVADTWTALSYTFQDDVKIVGAEIMVAAVLLDVHINADGDLTMLADLSRAGLPLSESCIVAVRGKALWHAAIVVGGEINKQNQIIFPQGYGVEVDEGEIVNLNMYGLWIGAGGDVTVGPQGILYYVER